MKNQNNMNQKTADEEVLNCSHCGKKLNKSELLEIVSNYDLLIKNFSECKKDGKFEGDLCSNIFQSKEEQKVNPKNNLGFFGK